jgi:hypothetical protein
MAILTSEQLAKRRQAVTREMFPAQPIDYLKQDLNLALQAMEDWITSNALRDQMRDKISEVTPVFTPAQRDIIWKAWLEHGLQVEI